MHWRVENIRTKEVKYYDPKLYSLVVTDAKLYNQKAGASKINTGETDKDVVAWVQGGTVMVLKSNTLSKSLFKDRLAYNPHVLPFWYKPASDADKESGKTAIIPDKTVRGDTIKNAGELVVDIDKSEYHHIITTGSNIFSVSDSDVNQLEKDAEDDDTKQLLEHLQ